MQSKTGSLLFFSEGKWKNFKTFGDERLSAYYDPEFAADLSAVREDGLAWTPLKQFSADVKFTFDEKGKRVSAWPHRKIHVFQTPSGRMIVLRTLRGTHTGVMDALHLSEARSRGLPFEKLLAVILYARHPTNRVEYITEYVPGFDTLEEFLQTRGSQEREKAVQLAFEKIRQMHDENVVHGDLHGENILYNPEAHAVLFVDTQYTGADGRERSGRFSSWLTEAGHADKPRMHKLFDLAYWYHRLRHYGVRNLDEMVEKHYFTPSDRKDLRIFRRLLKER